MVDATVVVIVDVAVTLPAVAIGRDGVSVAIRIEKGDKKVNPIIQGNAKIAFFDKFKLYKLSPNCAKI